jgi:cytochrome c oxidase subunit II
MTGLIALLILVLLVVVTVQIGKISELSSKIRGEEEANRDSNDFNARFGLFFVVGFLIFVVGSAYYYKNYMLGYGPLKPASLHAGAIDKLFDITLFFTGIVFFATQIALFWFTYKYREMKGRKVLFIPHDNKLEVIWTAIPAVVMCGLVIGGLWAWNEIMADVKPGEDVLEIEATGSQFLWELRYPGADGLLGTKYFRNIDPAKGNSLGLDWKDKKNLDDFMADELVLPVGRKIRVRITAKDVLHDFYLPHFKVKMDAIPGLPTYFVFTPTMTTEQYRLELKKYPEYNVPTDPNEPNGPKKWETFTYELACAELCGKGHFSMRKLVRVVSPAEYEKWAAAQKSIYEQNIKGKEYDPYLNSTAAAAPAEFSVKALETATAGTTLQLNHINFATGSPNLAPESMTELEALVEAMKKYPNLKVEVAGHTDNVGDPRKNLALSEARAASVDAYLEKAGIPKERSVAKGYGDSKPLFANDSEEHKRLNRRTEFVVLSK